MLRRRMWKIYFILGYVAIYLNERERTKNPFLYTVYIFFLFMCEYENHNLIYIIVCRVIPRINCTCSCVEFKQIKYTTEWGGEIFNTSVRQ